MAIRPFAVVRAQLLLHCTHLLKLSGEIPPQLPLYLSSPMAKNETALYHKKHKDHRLAAAPTKDMSEAAKTINTVEESKALNFKRMPMAIITGSGMATGVVSSASLKSLRSLST